ncbi:hypothetical protein [Empedobacter sp. ULE_I140]
MPHINDRNQILFFLLCFLTVFYVIFSSIYGLDNIDSGFILSFIGRIDAGQTLYKDFDLVRPFGNVIFWDLLLKVISKDSHYLLLISRFIFVLESLLISFFLMKIANVTQYYKIYTLLIFFLFIHYFNLMPWHTVDGIFFGVIAIYFCQRKYFLSSIILSLIAASSKQSFYIFAAFTIAVNLVLLYKNGYKIKKKDFLFFLFTILCIVFISYKYDLFNNFNLFIQQTSNSSSLKQLFQAGVKTYFFNTTLKNILFLVFLIFVWFYNSTSFTTILFYISAFTLFITYLSPINQHIPANYINILFVYFVVLFIKFKKVNISGLLIIVIAWCSSLSWGYNSPIFLIGYIFLYIFKDYLTYRFLLIGCILTLSVFSYIRLMHPYFNKNFEQTPYVYCNDLPIVSGIFMPQEIYLNYKEGITISKKYKKVIFIPGNPMMDIMTKSYYNRASWEMDVEFPSNKIDKSTRDNSVTFAIDKNPAIRFDDGFFKSTYTSTIIKTRSKIDSTKSYYIYK